MAILNMIVIYLVLGTVFTLIVDLSTEYARKKGIEIPDNGEWNNETRLLAILVWPIGLLFFINGYIKARFGNNDKNK